jgi:shikimate kinase
MGGVYLIGFMGAGKTTVGRLLAERLSRPFADLDDEIVAQQGASVSDIFATRGETGFRDAERAALARLAATDAVVACGGGVVTDDGSRAVLARAGTVVYLRVSADEALARVGSDTSERPLLRDADPAAAASLLASREALYAAAADLSIDTAGLSPDAVADEIAARLEGVA